MEKLITDILETHNELVSSGKTSEALYLLNKIAVETLNLLGATSYENTGNKLSALRYLNMAKTLDISNWMVHSNISHICNRSEDFLAAEKAAKDAAQWCNRSAADPYYNLGVIQANLNKYEDCLASYKTAVSIKPDPIYQFNLGCELLKSGYFEEGWRYYEARITGFKEFQEIRGRFKCPNWDGSDVDSLFLYSEQGIGDLIQFMRYLPEVKKRCKRLILEAQIEMGEILKNFKEIDELILRTNVFHPVPDTSAAAAICSLPAIFKANRDNIPNETYLFIDGGKKPEEIKDENFNIGIVWAGNPDHPNDKQRSFPLNNFREISKLEGVELFSLQKDLNKPRKWSGNQKINLLEGAEDMELRDLGGSLKNLRDCAEMLNHLDLIITADTSVAHLAGAMGKKVFVLIPYVHDFRWLIDTDKSPWYPSMTLFRQKERDVWKHPFEQIVQVVAQLRDQKAQAR